MHPTVTRRTVSAGLCVAAMALATVRGDAQSQGLQSGGDDANFGAHTVTPGFLPDPIDIAVVSGGNIDARTLGLGVGCKGWVTRRPDAILRVTGPSSRLRVFVTAEGERVDTTLVIQHANGSWRCNDDSWNTLNPTVNLTGATGGQYNVWVGSFHEGEQIRATLHVTELDDQHPRP